MFGSFLSAPWLDAAVRSYDADRVPGLDYALIGYRTRTSSGSICHVQEWANGRLTNWERRNPLDSLHCDVVIERAIFSEYQFLLGGPRQRSAALAATDVLSNDGCLGVADFIYPSLPYGGEPGEVARDRVTLRVARGVALDLSVRLDDGWATAEVLAPSVDGADTAFDVELDGQWTDLTYYVASLRRLNQCSTQPQARSGIWPFVAMSIAFNDESRRAVTCGRRAEICALVWSVSALAGSGADAWRSYLADGTDIDPDWWAGT